MSFRPIGPTVPTGIAVNQIEAGQCAGKGKSAALPSGTSAIAAWLSKQVPADMDRAAVLRALSHGVKLRVRVEGRYPRGANGERLSAYTVASGCDIHGDATSRAAAKADLQNFVAPPDPRTVEHWLAELSVLTAGRGREGIDAELMVNAYAERLGKYPADVVRYALLSKTWKWFPTWEDLEQECEVKTGPRRCMIAALSAPVPDPKPERRAPTQVERKRVAALVNEMFPAVSQEWRDAALSEALKGNCMKGDSK